MDQAKSLAKLHELIEAINSGQPGSQEAIAAGAEEAYREQQYPLAYDLYQALKAPTAYQLYRKALSALNVGAVQRAEELLPEIGEPGEDMARNQAIDILCLPGRIAKEKWLRTEGAGAPALALVSAAEYASVMALYDDYFSGINAATMFSAAGDADRSRRLAQRVTALCEAELGERNSPWVLATLGEAALLLGDVEKAARRYRQAAEAAAGNADTLGSMRRQLRVFKRVLGEIPESVSLVLDAGRVVVFSGHMIDHPQRPDARFPAHLEVAVKEQIKACLQALGARHGFSSAACGSDLLFLESLNELNAKANIILPFPREDFVHTSVAFAGDQWVKRFDDCLDHNPWQEVTGEPFLGEDALFEHGNEVLLGNAINFAQQIGADVVLLAALDLEAEAKQGGAQSVVQHCRDHGIEAQVVDIGPLRRAAPPTVSAGKAAPAVPEAASWTRILTEKSNREIRTMLFADVVGFSKIPEHQLAAFFLHFLGEIEATIEASPRKPLLANTWGDGLYVVYEGVLGAADFALRIRDAVKERDWQAVGLPAGTSVRIGMHSGPVFVADDPVIKRRNAFGSHVNRAARIEPVTVPGAVFLSAAAAALIAASGSREFACDYLGLIELAKKYDRVPLYRLRRSGEFE